MSCARLEPGSPGYQNDFVTTTPRPDKTKRLTSDRGSRVIASVSELILNVYGKNKQDLKPSKVIVKRFFFHVESIFDVTRPDPTQPDLDAFPSLISQKRLDLES